MEQKNFEISIVRFQISQFCLIDPQKLKKTRQRTPKTWWRFVLQLETRELKISGFLDEPKQFTFHTEGWTLDFSSRRYKIVVFVPRYKKKAF